MNIKEIRKLKPGDKIKSWIPSLTNGKEYDVIATPTGRSFIDDNGQIWHLSDWHLCFKSPKPFYSKSIKSSLPLHRKLS